MASLMKKAQQSRPQGEQFTPKDPREFVPPEHHDAVDRVVAAGLKLMYSPEMAQERQQAIDSPEPPSKKMADNVTGLMLTLDKKSRGGLPQEAIFPAAVMLLNDAGEILVKAGQPVNQNDYNESIQIVYVQIGKKLGATDNDLMKGAENALAAKGGVQSDSTDPQAQADPTQQPDPGQQPGGPGPMTAAYPGGMPAQGVQPPPQGA